jgi:multisubunit Na+/H+ antiporter MnhG subunit
MTLEVLKAIALIIVFVLTAALSGYLIPRITRDRKGYQKELEIKTSIFWKRVLTLEVLKAIVPIIVVVLTATLSGYLIPRITRDWQDYQKELEIKTSIVEKANVEILNILLAMQFAERGVGTQTDFDRAYQNWEIQRAALEGKISVYFHGQTVAKDFHNFSEALTDFYALAGVNNPAYRAKQIVKLKNYFGENATDWVTLEDQTKRSNDFYNWFFSWWKVRQEVLLRKDVVLSKLLAQPIVLLRPSKD